MTPIHTLRSTPESEIPDDFIPCCMGSAEYGPDRCTCWEPVYSTVHVEVIGWRQLVLLSPGPAPGSSSTCTPTARRKPAEFGSYEPAHEGLVAFKADGTPADLCAGWKVHRDRLQRPLVGGDTDLPGGCVGVTSGESGGVPESQGPGRETGGASPLSAAGCVLTAAASPDPNTKRPPETAPATLRGKGVSGVPSTVGAVSGGRPDKQPERTTP